MTKDNNNGIDIVEKISQEFCLHEKIARLLVMRGIDSVDKVTQFLEPSVKDFFDPFLLCGMTECVERLKQAAENNETVLIYGDYDADGICSSAILYDYFCSIGIDARVYIPDRKGDGYGLNIETIERIAEEHLPDLIMTCDCGISGHKEVDHILDLGIDCIVSDHHEIPEILPQCVTVNPKLKEQKYPFDQLCGAGVAFKIVQAMAGINTAKKYLDLAAVASIADLVPLVGENRLIVTLGLILINMRRNLGLRKLFSFLKLDYDLNSSDIAFKIVPRINAAGRMGDAYRAFELLTSKDEPYIDQLIKELEVDNNKRKQACEVMFSEAMEALSEDDLLQRFILQSNPNWEKGISGIAAARIVNTLNRPVFLMTETDETQLKGTARGIEGLNIYEILKSAQDLLTEFGGHNQAAGFSLEKDKLGEFKQRLKQAFSNTDSQAFLPKIKYDLEIEPNDISKEFVESLKKLEPFGQGNSKPTFLLKAGELKVQFFKPPGAHIELSLNGKNIMAFNQSKNATIFSSSAQKNLFVDVDINNYNKKARAVLKNYCYDVEGSVFDEQRLLSNYIAQLINYKKQEFQPHYIDKKSLSEIVQNAEIYGTMFVAYNAETYRQFIKEHELAQDFMFDYLCIHDKNNYTRVILGAEIELAKNYYKQLVFLDKPLNMQIVEDCKSLVSTVLVCDNDYNLQNIDLTRECFVEHFKAITKFANTPADNIFDFCNKLEQKTGLPAHQSLLSSIIFNELGFIQFTTDDFRIIINKNQKSNLSESEIYCLLLNIKGDK